MATNTPLPYGTSCGFPLDLPSTIETTHSASTGVESDFLNCGFCILSTHKSSTIRLSSCGHVFCRECVQVRVEHSAPGDVSCMVPYCVARFTPAELKSIENPFSNPDDFLEQLAETLPDYNDFNTYKHYNASFNPRHDCLDKLCKGSFAIKDGLYKYLCEKCSKTNCLDCGVAGDCRCVTLKRKLEPDENAKIGKVRKSNDDKALMQKWDETWKLMCSRYSVAPPGDDGLYAAEEVLEKFVATANQTPTSKESLDPILKDITINPSEKEFSTTVPAHSTPHQSYNCFKPGCTGTVLIIPPFTNFRCSKCGKFNCIICKAQHGSMRCQTYRNRAGTTAVMPFDGGMGAESPYREKVQLKELNFIPSSGNKLSQAAFRFFVASLPTFGDMKWENRNEAGDAKRGILFLESTNASTEIVMDSQFPFRCLNFLLSNPLVASGDCGVYLRRAILGQGVLKLAIVLTAVYAQVHYEQSSLALLPIDITDGITLTYEQIHQKTVASPALPTSGFLFVSSLDKASNKGWAKGVGYGYGSTRASPNNAITTKMKLEFEEENVICLIGFLTNFLHLDFSDSNTPVPTNQTLNALWSETKIVLAELPFIEVLTSYLRNDSVLDMANHIPLYTAVLELIQCVVKIPLLASLITVPKHNDGDSIFSLVSALNEIVTAYASHLNFGQKVTASVGISKKPGTSTQVQNGDELLMDLVVSTFDSIKKAENAEIRLRQRVSATAISATSAESSRSTAIYPDDIRGKVITKSNAEIYMAAMKKLQFGLFEMIVAGVLGPKFAVAYSYEKEVFNITSAIPNAGARLKRLAQENVTLSRALPLSFHSSVFVRFDTDRIDVMKVLITGPVGTPYANGCFEFDVHFPKDYPRVPPMLHFRTTGGRRVRFNPNLYQDGKVCLSLLNTWDGTKEEMWNPTTSNMIQVLVAIQSLIMVSDPYFNEPGYQSSKGTLTGEKMSEHYNAQIREHTMEWAMVDQLKNPSPCFKEVIETHFYLKRKEILEECDSWIGDEMASQVGKCKSPKVLLKPLPSPYPQPQPINSFFPSTMAMYYLGNPTTQQLTLAMPRSTTRLRLNFNALKNELDKLKCPTSLSS